MKHCFETEQQGKQNIKYSYITRYFDTLLEKKRRHTPDFLHTIHAVPVW